MKTQIKFFGILTAIIISVCAIFISCEKEDVNNVVTYTGKVVYANTTTPFADCLVQVTDGNNIHCQGFTDASGAFSLQVRVNDINGDYYLLAGDATCVPKKVSLGGYGQAQVNLGIIEVEGPSLPVVTTKPISSVNADAAVCGGEVVSDGRLEVTARGVCYSPQPYPTIESLHTTDGNGLGEFTSNLKELQHNTIYYARAYATNKIGTAYGEQVKFTTEEGVPIVVTDEIIRITAHGAKCKGRVESDGGYPVTVRGTCWSKHPDPTVDDDCTNDGSGLGEFTSTLSGLTVNTQYYVRTYATNSTSTVYGEQIAITTLDGMAKVTTASVTNIGSVKATCGGEVTDDGTLTVTARGVCYGTEQHPTIEDMHTTDGKGVGAFVSNIKNLSDKTTYYVRAYATTDAGTSYGEQRTFKTENGVPVVEMSELGQPTATSIICSGNVTGDGGVTISERGFCYSTSQYPTNTDAHIAVGNGTGEYTASINNLSVNTKYYVRAYAVNSLGIGYSAQQSFTTQNGLPSVTTSQPTATATTINVGGEITSNGGFNVTERGICYSTTNSEPTITDEKEISGKGNGIFSVSITGLTAGTTYYLRAYAINENGVAYGQTVTVTTSNGTAAVTLGDISNIMALTASASVTVGDAGGANLQSCGICWSLNPSPTIEDNKAVATGQQLNTAYPCNMSGLQPNTTYYVRAYATTNVTTTYSTQKSFETKDGLPIISTATATSATSTTITSGGTITSDGGYSITARGVCYSTNNPTPTVEDNYTTAGIGTGSFSSVITIVSFSTTYYVRAYATNSIGTAYGDVKTVTTGNGLPIVKTTNIGENVTETTAISGGQVTDDGDFAVTARGVCWSTLPYPTINDYKTTDGSGTGYYSSTITGINLNSTNIYYVRAYATNQNGTSYGEQVTVKKENLDYKNLPTVVYGKYIYKIYPDLGSAMKWDAANTACNNLVYVGYDDWFLPSSIELWEIMQTVSTGWKKEDGTNFNMLSDEYSAYYWTSPEINFTASIRRYHYGAQEEATSITNNPYGAVYRVRPVRKYLASN